MCGSTHNNPIHQHPRTVEVSAAYLEKIERELNGLRLELIQRRLAEHGQTSLEG